jgi:hypothetical protein
MEASQRPFAPSRDTISHRHSSGRSRSINSTASAKRTFSRSVGCPHCNREVPNSEIVKNYDFERGRHFPLGDSLRCSTIEQLDGCSRG